MTTVIYFNYDFGRRIYMLILGFQKMSLLDYPGKVAATVFTGGCNFRCPFCHNSGLVTDIRLQEAYDTEDVLAYLKARRGLLDGVAVTGGEPLLQKDIEEFLMAVKSLGYPVKLDTNGSYPDKLREVCEKKLVDYVAMDIKNTMEMYGKTVGIDDFDTAPILESIRFLHSGAVDYEFRTTVVLPHHTVNRIEQMAKTIAPAPRYFLQRFTDSGHLIAPGGLSAADDETMENMAENAREYIPCVEIRG